MTETRRRSLRLRVTVALLVSLVAVLGSFAYLEYLGQRHLVIQQLRSSADMAGQIVESSLQHAMMANDFTIVQQIMDDIASQPEVQDVFLLDKEGEILLSADRGAVGRRLDLSDQTCQACHQFKAASRNESVILTNAQGMSAFRNVNAIENKAECQTCHSSQDKLLGVLMSDLSVEGIDRYSTALGRSRLLWSLGSIAIVLVIVNLVMSRFVVNRLEQFVRAIKRVSQGNLNAQLDSAPADEIGDLAQAFNRMTEGLREKDQLEQSLQERTQQLQAQTVRLSTLNTLAATVSQSLDLEQILRSALGKVTELLKARAGWIVLRDARNEGFHLTVSSGLPQELANVHAHCAWQRCLCAEVLEQGRTRTCREIPTQSCPLIEYLAHEGMTVRTCVPVRSKDRVLGVMSLAGAESLGADGFAQDTLELLTAIGQQIGIAVENASLYAELQQKEAIRRQLLERLISVQEEERKRIALELHDQTGQPLASLMMTLQVIEKAGTLAEVQSHIRDLQRTSAQVLGQVHDLALELRPRLLDDLGLPAAVRHYCRQFQDRFRLPVDFQVLGLEGVRLAPEVETALYRILQEALTNVARHAHAQNVSVLLETRGSSVVLIVEDDGRGFDVDGALGAHATGVHLGLYGMQERAALLGGALTIESAPGMGAALFAEIPWEKPRSKGDQDPNPDR